MKIDDSLMKNINNFNYRIEYTTPAYNPFRYVILDNFFEESYYQKLIGEYKKLQYENQFLKFNADYASEEQSKWSICHLSGREEPESHFMVFATNAFKKFINSIFPDIQITNNISMEIHNHPKNDIDGWVHNDYDCSNFVDSKLDNGINVWNQNSNYRQKHDPPEHYIRNARAIALIYYFNPMSVNWKDGDGGETGLYTHSDDNVDNPIRKISPIPNRLAIYEINPYSWHAITMKNKEERISYHMWYHADLNYYTKKYEYTGHSPLDGF